MLCHLCHDSQVSWKQANSWAQSLVKYYEKLISWSKRFFNFCNKQPMSMFVFNLNLFLHFSRDLGRLPFKNHISKLSQLHAIFCRSLIKLKSFSAEKKGSTLIQLTFFRLEKSAWSRAWNDQKWILKRCLSRYLFHTGHESCHMILSRGMQIVQC